MGIGSNEIELVELYLGLEKQLKSAEMSGDSQTESLLKAKMSGIRIGYNIYLSENWDSFDHLLKKYEQYNY